METIVQKIGDCLRSAFSDLLAVIIMLVLLFPLLWLFVRIKRWYIKAHVNRSVHDGKMAIDYISFNNKNLSSYQRIILNLIGVDPSFFNLWIIIIWIIVGTPAVFFLNSITSSNIGEIILWFLGLIFAAFFLKDSIKEFLLYARIIPLILLVIEFILFFFMEINALTENEWFVNLFLTIEHS